MESCDSKCTMVSYPVWLSSKSDVSLSRVSHSPGVWLVVISWCPELVLAQGEELDLASSGRCCWIIRHQASQDPVRVRRTSKQILALSNRDRVRLPHPFARFQTTVSFCRSHIVLGGF